MKELMIYTVLAIVVLAVTNISYEETCTKTQVIDADGDSSTISDCTYSLDWKED